MDGETGFRAVFIERTLHVCESNQSSLSEWESNFIKDISRVHRVSWKRLITHQYNTLMEIYNKVKR